MPESLLTVGLLLRFDRILRKGWTPKFYESLLKQASGQKIESNRRTTFVREGPPGNRDRWCSRHKNFLVERTNSNSFTGSIAHAYSVTDT